ncbi:hypothetical protein, conserved [Eimeria maxima]|uniref:Uncharacterized protein n=1 Tax=Eimeria maxima TaxID=5804 RepID=U6ME92_EIMMA|nr:hypothetical protein, conserved [Eimeria maxima]CDJ59995.1 hypothetical protein, conserved [Eimeria maxima]
MLMKAKVINLRRVPPELQATARLSGDTAYWNEVFEPIVQDPQLLQRLQTTVICWASQDLSRFDGQHISSFLADSSSLLKGLDRHEYLNYALYLNNIH